MKVPLLLLIYCCLCIACSTPYPVSVERMKSVPPGCEHLNNDLLKCEDGDSNIYGLKMSECNLSKAPTVLSLTRGLLSGFKDIVLLKQERNDDLSMTTHATATLDLNPVQLLVKSRLDAECVHDMVVWESGVTEPKISESFLAHAHQMLEFWSEQSRGTK